LPLHNMLPITPARVALCAAVQLYLDSEDEEEVTDADSERMGTLLLRVLQAEGASEGTANPELGSDATLVDVLALLQVLTTSDLQFKA
jgi:hypothetical protein